MHRRRSFRSMWVLVIASAVWAAAPRAQDRTAEEAAQEQQLRAARASLATQLKAGVEGRFVERMPGSYVFLPAPVDLPQAIVVNPEAVSSFAVGPLLMVRGGMQADGRLTVAAVQLAAVRVPEGSADALPRDVADAATDVRRMLDASLKPGTMSVKTRDTVDPKMLTRLAEVRRAYKTAADAGDQRLIVAILRQWAALRQTVGEFYPDSQDFKALYGETDNYEPWRYDVIFRQAPAVVAIGDRDGTPPSRCSGALIDDDLVLTAGHCLLNREPEQLEVWFQYARSRDGSVPTFLRRPVVELVAPSPARLPDLMKGAFDSKLLDYAILRFAAAPGEPLSPTGAEPLCVRTRQMSKGDAVYVVGYPKGDPVMVHDSARIYLPYRVRFDQEYEDLKLNVETDLVDARDRVTFMKEFAASYATIRKDGVLTYRFLHHVKDYSQPRMGIIADTFKGNSGGPVFDRTNRQCIVGVFVSGAPDTGERLTASWKQHERVVPISVVLDDAERVKPGLKKQLTLVDR